MNIYILIFAERPRTDSIPDALIGPDVYASREDAFKRLFDYVLPCIEHQHEDGFDSHCKKAGVDNHLKTLEYDFDKCSELDVEYLKMACDYFFMIADLEPGKDAFYVIEEHDIS